MELRTKFDEKLRFSTKTGIFSKSIELQPEPQGRVFEL
tara:strand:- start:542 stop:655 length:114 start_codon:yes stop_codon:yes gene_type:complete